MPCRVNLGGGEPGSGWSYRNPIIAYVAHCLQTAAAVVRQGGQIGDPNAGGSDDLTLNAGFDDTWHASLGAQYQATPDWLWSAGLAYDSSAVSDSKRSWTLPMGETVTLGLGATVAMAENSSLNVSYSLTSIDDWTIENNKPEPDPANDQFVNGEFSNNWVQVVSASMNWRF